MTNDVLPRIRPEIAALPPYRQGRPAEAGGFKLSSNENPFTPLPGVVEAAQAAVAGMNRYPDATATALRTALGERYGVAPEGVLVGAGSVSVISAFLLAACGPGDEVIYAWRSFEAYPGLALVAGATSVQVPLRADAGHDLDAMAAAITDRTRCVILCTPNNPTGPIITSAGFHAFMARVPADLLVLLDEAYAEFVTAEGAVDGLGERVHERYPNVVVLRTFSKAYGLAGLRVGYGIGHPRVLDAARSTLTPLSVTAESEAAALASLAVEAELRERVAVIVERRDRLAAELRADGFSVPDSQSNFLWLPDARPEVAAAFDADNLIVRAFPDGVRISIGEEESLPRIRAALAPFHP